MSELLNLYVLSQDSVLPGPDNVIKWKIAYSNEFSKVFPSQEVVDDTKKNLLYLLFLLFKKAPEIEFNDVSQMVKLEDSEILQILSGLVDKN